MQANDKVFLFQFNHISKVFSLEYWIDEMKWVWVHRTNKSQTVYQIPLKSMENCVRYLPQKVLLSRTPVKLNRGQGQLG